MLVLLMTIVSLSVIVIYFTNEKAYKDYYDNSTEQMRIVSNAVNIFYEQIDHNIDMLATNPVIKQVDGSITTYKNTTQATAMHPSTNRGIEQEIYEIFEQYAESHEGTSYVYLGTANGGYIQWPEETTEVGFNPTTEPWYEMSMDADGNNADNNFKNVNDVNIEGLDRLLSEEQAPFTVRVDGVKYIVNPYRIEGTDWILGSFISKAELESGARTIVIIVAISALTTFVIAFLLLSYVAKSISKPILVVTDRMGQFADLDFSPNSTFDVEKFMKRNDEVGSMVRALHVMRENVANFITGTSEAAERVAASSEELTATSLEAATSSEEIAMTIEEIAKGVEEQANDTEVTSNNIDEMGNLIEQNFNYLKELNAAAIQIEQQKEEGINIISSLIDNNKSNNDASNNVYQIILSNNESVEKIEIASSKINDLASQTNLLALNATIEAARAGEAGKRICCSSR